MIPLLSREQMRAFDAHAITTCHVPSLVLMENAGRGATDVLVRELLDGSAVGRRVTVVCGTGNNGGDGFVVARHLASRGAVVEVILAGDANRMTSDCRANHAAFVGIGGRVALLSNDVEPLRKALSVTEVCVDALFGTGLDRALGDPFLAIVRAVDEARCRKLALDVPSGMNADTGAPMGGALHADVTVTFAHPKLGHLTPSGARISGDVHVVDIGVPPSLRASHVASLVESRDVRALLSPRTVDVHKYRAGHVALFAGSAGKIGASLLAASGALRGGAGAATIVTWPDAASVLDSRVLEVMTSRLAGGDGLLPSVDVALGHKRAVVLGPGFGTGDDARAAIEHVLATYDGMVVVDADALTVRAGAIERFASARGRLVLTPHAGELARLLGTTSEAVEADRFGVARSAAARANAVVLLKGAHTIVASPGGEVVVNSTGNPSLATAGAGDVLAGLLGALACSLDPFEAAYAAAYLHGAAADAWRARNADRGLLAGEIATELPQVIKALVGAS